MLPLLSTRPTTQNHRVSGYDVPSEDDSVIYRLVDSTSNEQVEALIWAAYRQIFSEHLILETYRQKILESQLKNRQISVREFIRGLGKSEIYRRLVVETNSNYRLVDLSFTRFLGRSTYGQDEQIANSIIIASQGLDSFIDSLVDSAEYLENFGEDIVPYQRRRFGERPFNLVTPRYSDYWRAKESALYTSGRSAISNRASSKTSVSNTRIRSGIPATFFSLANSINIPQADYQYAASGGVNTSRIDIPDMTSSSAAPVSRRSSSMPYSYLPK